ncbi:hypothetical protein A2U01_0083647, partial [Trifolium medium]|nr:hypothetical protein [Trifolium medium]
MTSFSSSVLDSLMVSLKHLTASLDLYLEATSIIVQAESATINGREEDSFLPVKEEG